MKYILILSLFYKHYKKASTLKLFLDNSLIDEIVLDKNIDPIPNFQEKHSQTIDKVAVDSYRDATWVIKKLQTLKETPLGPPHILILMEYMKIPQHGSQRKQIVYEETGNGWMNMWIMKLIECWVIYE